MREPVCTCCGARGRHWTEDCPLRPHGVIEFTEAAYEALVTMLGADAAPSARLRALLQGPTPNIR